MFGFTSGSRRRAGRRRSRRARGPHRRPLRIEALESRRVLSIAGGVSADTIFPAGNVDQHQFAISPANLAAAGGEYVVTLSVSAGSGAFLPQAGMFAPGGSRIGSDVTAGSKSVFRLTAAGIYTVRVADNDGRDTGDYWIGLEGLNPPSSDSKEIEIGQVKSGTLVEGGIDAYTFTAQAGDVITLSLAQTESLTAGYFPRAELYHAVSGDRIALNSTTTAGKIREFLAGRRYISPPLARSGTYVIQVYDNNYTHTHANGYAIALEGVKPPSKDAVGRVLGQVTSGRIERGEIDALTFVGTAGDLVTVSLSDAAPGTSTELWAELYAPSGQKVSKLSSTPGDHEVRNGNRVIYRLPETATAANPYVIQVYDNNYTDAEDYALALEGISPLSLDARAIAVGQTLTGTIDVMGEVDTFHFTLSADDLASSGGAYTVQMNFTSDDTVDYKPRASVLKPSGHELDDLRAGQTKLLTLTEPGRYVVQVADSDYTHSKQALLDRGRPPEYSLSLRDAAPPRVLEVAVSDTLLTDADVGTPLAVSVVFSESMDTAAVPELVFTPLVASGTAASLVNPSAGAWTHTAAANDTFTIHYQLADRNVEVPSVRVGVSGARDTSGNLQQPYLALHEFQIDTRNPAVSSLSPADNATGVAWDAKLSITFDQAIVKGQGSAVIRRSGDDAVMATVPIGSAQVAISGTRATIDPQIMLQGATGYYVEVTGGAFRDSAGNPSAAIQGKTAWNFTTVSTSGLNPPVVAQPLPDLVFPLGATGRTVDLSGVFDDPDLPLGDSLTITYSDAAGNTNPELVRGQLDGMSLILTLTSGMAGRAELTVTCSDTAGQTVSDTFVVRVATAPVAVDDLVTTDEDVPVEIHVTANDSDADGPVRANTVAVVPGSGPAHGSLVVDQGVITYTPAANFFGSDSFRYTIRDDDGAISNQATVSITVVEVADYHNAWVRGDVNNSGEVSPLDALIVINYINALGLQLPPDPIPPAKPTYYYDVNGDNRISPLDVLEIINILNASAGGSGEGEQAEWEALVVALDSFLARLEPAAPAAAGERRESPPRAEARPPAGSRDSNPTPLARPARGGALSPLAVRAVFGGDWADPNADSVLAELGLDLPGRGADLLLPP